MKRTDHQAAYAAMELDRTDPFFAIIADLTEEDGEDFDFPAAECRKPAMTDQQLRALSRKHLLMMLCDLEKELQQERSEKKNLLLACRAGLPRGQQPYGW